MTPLPSSPDSLRRSLQAWRVSPPVDPVFRGGVWARIEALRREAEASWSQYVRHHVLLWSLALVVTAGGSALIGQRAAEHRERTDRDAMVHTYLAAIDARLMHP